MVISMPLETCYPNCAYLFVSVNPPNTQTIPSELLGFYAKDSAYYIRCHGCRQRFLEDPKLWEAWQEEMRETEAKLQSLRASA
jgi:hypothetical protein